MTAALLLILEASQPPPRIEMICTIPNGMLNRIVVNLSYPNAEMIREPNVPIPPLTMLK